MGIDGTFRKVWTIITRPSSPEINLQLTSLMNLQSLGSDPYGRPLRMWTCARSHNSEGAVAPCRELGSSFCSKCRQVKYCSKDCQVTHWKLHKKNCTSPYTSDDWTPSWNRENRPPAYLNKGPGVAEPISFGKAGNYLWGNMPAADILNVTKNEGSAVRGKDLALCFAASGDLRNVIKTVNGLPEDYHGQLTLVINDFHSQVAIRNVVLLCMLLDPSGPSDELTAEVVLHALYSARLTESQAASVQSWMDCINMTGRGPLDLFDGHVEFGSQCELAWLYPGPVAAQLRLIRNATYTTSQAETDRRRIMLSPQRIDYRERYWSTLRPRHRLGFTYWRETGLLLPIGQPVNSFNTVNRLLYSEDGEWLLKDNASPAAAWDPLEVDATRQRLKLPEEDYIGNLFFHIKHQLVEFIKRVRRFKLNVFLLSMDLLDLPEFLDLIDGNNTKQLTFDRVETSNVMDTVGPSAILATWAPRLNRDNPHSCLLMYSMNWPFKVSGGHADSLGKDKVEKIMMQLATYLGFKKGKLTKPPPIGLFSTNLGALFDTRPPFSRYLREHGTQEAARTFKVRERKTPRILPPRLGVQIDHVDSPKITITPEQFYWIGSILYPTWHERFLEFEAVP